MIIAVDFDGVLCEDKFPSIGAPNYDMISYIRQLIDAGHEVILWTSRVDARLDEAVKWCHDYGLHFCAVNDNSPSNKAQYEKEYPGGTRKVYADIYLEDHCPWFFRYDADSRRGCQPVVKKLIDYTEYMIRNWEGRRNED